MGPRGPALSTSSELGPQRASGPRGGLEAPPAGPLPSAAWGPPLPGANTAGWGAHRAHMWHVAASGSSAGTGGVKARGGGGGAAGSKGRGCREANPSGQCRQGRATLPPSPSALSVRHSEHVMCEPIRCQVGQEPAPVRMAPECPSQQHGCPEPWETRGDTMQRHQGSSAVAPEKEAAAELGPQGRGAV